MHAPNGRSWRRLGWGLAIAVSILAAATTAEADSAQPPGASEAAGSPACTPDRIHNELCAQVIAARAAYDAAIAARTSLVWNVAAFFALLLTLIATAWSARAASRAAAAADRSVEVAEATGKRQIRAYLEVAKGEIDGITPGQHPHARLTLVNVGQTPARNVLIHGVFAIGPYPAPDSFFALATGSEPPSRGQIGSGQPRQLDMTFDRPWSSDDAEKFAGLRSAFYVWGRISYEDVFGAAWTTPFRLHHCHTTTAGRFHYSEKGNEAT